jgi:hypothetical protein
MGKLLSLLARDDASTCCSPQKYDVYLDFESEQIARVRFTAARNLPVGAFIVVDFEGFGKFLTLVPVCHVIPHNQGTSSYHCGFAFNYNSFGRINTVITLSTHSNRI